MKVHPDSGRPFVVRAGSGSFVAITVVMIVVMTVPPTPAPGARPHHPVRGPMALVVGIRHCGPEVESTPDPGVQSIMLERRQ